MRVEIAKCVDIQYSRHLENWHSATDKVYDEDIRNWAKPAGGAFWSIEAVEKVPCSPFRLSKFLSSRFVALWNVMDFVNIYRDFQSD